jgi:hypothetical protein
VGGKEEDMRVARRSSWLAGWLGIGFSTVLLTGCSDDPDDGAGDGSSKPTSTAKKKPAQTSTPSKDDAAPDDSDEAMAGSSAEPGAGDEMEPTGVPGEHSVTSDECQLDTGYPGDEYCILPPPPDKGFQLHIGPSDYDNIDPSFILAPHAEATSNFGATASNDEQIYFYYRQYRMRPGSHHMIVTESSGAGGGIADIGGRRIGTANLSQDSPVGGEISPENKGVGIPLGAKAPINVSLHSINVTEQPILREVWVNFWYRDPSEVSEPAISLFKIGDPSFTIPAGGDQILGPYSCDITGSGRLLWFYGHRHANNVRFSAWRARGSQRDLFYEGLVWEEPLLLEYSSTVKNPVPDQANGVEGGWSGVLDLQPGDRLEWECHVINKQTTPLRFTNETYLGEMCIMDGETVGASCSGL